MYGSNALGHTTYWGTTYYSLKLVVGESWIHTVPVGLTEGTLGLRLPNGVRVLRDCLTGLGLLAGAGGFGRLGLSTVHTTVGGTRYSTIATRRTPPSNTLAGSLTGGPQLGDFLAKLGNFGEEGIHFCLGILEGRGT
jgi:hypothetical protein